MRNAKRPTKAEETRRMMQGESVLGTDVLLPGYPGLTHTAHLIAEYIPKCKIFVEPFAGLGRVHVHVNAEQYVLNDMSDTAIKHLKKFQARVTQQDFVKCILENDSADTFFFLDPPWRFGIYEHNAGPFIDRKPLDYYEKFFELVPKLKGDWILCSDKDEHEIRKICSKSGFPTLKIDSKKTLFKKKIGVLLTSNKPFVRTHPTMASFF